MTPIVDLKHYLRRERKGVVWFEWPDVAEMLLWLALDCAIVALFSMIGYAPRCLP